MNLKRILIVPLVLLAAGVALAACGSGSDSQKTEVSDAWARSSPPGQATSAIYAKLTAGDKADRLVAVSVPTDVAEKAEIHETTESDTGDTDSSHMDGEEMDGDHMDGNESEADRMEDGAAHEGGSMPAGDHGTMSMRQVAGVDVPAGREVMLEPGGFHIMLFELAGPLKAGDTVPVTFTFERAGEIKVDAEVRDS